jgi:hypothetical protein
VSNGSRYEGQGQPAGIHEALGTDLNVVIVVRNPFDHTVFPISHMLEPVASSMGMLSRVGQASLMAMCREWPVWTESLLTGFAHYGLSE